MQPGIDAPIQIPSLPKPLFPINRPTAVSFANGVLEISAGPKTDIYWPPNGDKGHTDAPMLLFEPDKAFSLRARIQLSFDSRWDAGGFMIYADEHAWVKFSFEKDYQGHHTIVSVVTKGLSDDCNSHFVKGDDVHMQIARNGSAYTLHYSLDGKAWYLVRTFSLDPNLKYRIGFLAQSPDGPQCTARFQDIRYKPEPPKDFWIGE